MMRGYDREEALAYMMTKINREDHKKLGDLVDTLLAQAIDADMAYMHEAGVLDADGNAGEVYYEEDDAFEFIVERIADLNTFSPEQAVDAAMLVNDFMDLQAEYMEKKGLVSYD